MPKEEPALNRRFQYLKYTLGFHIPHTPSFLNLFVPAPGDTWNNLNRQVWPLRQKGDLHSKDVARVAVSTPVLFYFSLKVIT